MIGNIRVALNPAVVYVRLRQSPMSAPKFSLSDFNKINLIPFRSKMATEAKQREKCWRLFITLKMRSIAFRRLSGCLGIQNFNSEGWCPLHSGGWNTSICLSWKNFQKKVAVYFPWHHEIIDRMWKRGGNLAWRIIFLFSFLENRRKLGIQVEFNCINN